VVGRVQGYTVACGQVRQLNLSQQITPHQFLLRKKNRLMRAGRVEKAGAIACRIRKEILKGNRLRLQKYNGRVDAKEICGRQYTAADWE